MDSQSCKQAVAKQLIEKGLYSHPSTTSGLNSLRDEE